MLRRFLTTFAAGLLAALPLVITVAVIAFILSKLNALLGPQSGFGRLMRDVEAALRLPAGFGLPYIASVLLVVLAIWLLGLVARRVTGRRMGGLVTMLIGKIPFINKVYNSAEQVVGLLARKDGDAAGALSNVVLVRIANFKVLGMLASHESVEVDGKPHYIVFLPSTPVPASGQNLVVPCEDVLDVDVSVEEMTRILISLGSLGPAVLNSKHPLVLEG
jgi:uncharacterized membrane protein